MSPRSTPTFRFGALAVAAWLGVSSALADKVANVVARSTSIHFGTARDREGVRFVFTEPDCWPECQCIPCCPREVHEGAPTLRGSGELRPGTELLFGNYFSDYYGYDSSTPRFNGMFFLLVPGIDDDANGVPDVLQVERSVALTTPARMTWNSGTDGERSAECRWNRIAGQNVGTYELTIAEGVSARVLRGAFSLVEVRGFVLFNASPQSPANATLKVQVVFPDGGVRTFEGDSMFRRVDETTLSLASAQLRETSGAGRGPLSFGGCKLVRVQNSNRFMGEAIFDLPPWFEPGPTSGGSGGFCPDWVDPQPGFNRFVLEVTDPADSDNNGVPDLLDTYPLPPKIPEILLQPDPLIVKRGSPAQFSVAARGRGVLSYQWYWESSPVPGGTAQTLKLSNVGPANAGDYRAVVSNEFGSVTSKVARLTVARLNPEPRIATAPRSVQANPGETARFSVVAEGEPVLRYQWFQDGQPLPAGTSANLERAGVGIPELGEYFVVVSNTFGSVKSAPVTLTVTGLPPRPKIVGVRPTTRGPEIDCGVAVGAKYRVDTSTDLKAWTVVSQFTATAPVQTVKHSFAAAQPGRYYRLVATAPP